MKRLLSLFAYRFPYRTHRRNLIIIYLLLLISMIASIALFSILASGVVLTGIIIALLVVFVIDIFLALAAIVYQSIVATSRVDQVTSQENFTKETYVYNEIVMKQVYSHIMRRRRSEGLLAVLDIRNVARLRNIYGPKGPKIINDSLIAAIKEFKATK